MMESSTPLREAVVAALILKLCPAYNELSMPRVERALQNSEVNLLFVSGEAPWNQKVGQVLYHGLTDS